MGKAKFNKGKSLDDLLPYIRKHLVYNPITGVIKRIGRPNCNGHLDKDGYLIIKIKGRAVKAHRLAWLMFYGVSPLKEIDHINHVRNDNRISNLREVDRCLNVHNSVHCANPLTHVIGVYIDRCTNGLKKKFTTRFKQKTYRFYSLEEAVNFRKEKGLAV